MNAISQYRKKNGLSQAAFAELVGVSQPTVCEVEKGKKRFSPQRAKHIEEVTGGELRREHILPEVFG